MYELTGGDLKQTSSYMGHSGVGITADTLAADSQLPPHVGGKKRYPLPSGWPVCAQTVLKPERL